MTDAKALEETRAAAQDLDKVGLALAKAAMGDLGIGLATAVASDAVLNDPIIAL